MVNWTCYAVKKMKRQAAAWKEIQKLIVSIYLTKSEYLKYIKNCQKSVVKSIQLEMGKKARTNIY